MDAAIATQLHALAVSQPWLSTLIVLLANYGVLLLPLSELIIWLRASTPEEYRRALVVGVVSACVAFLLGLILERSLSRPRPFVELIHFLSDILGSAVLGLVLDAVAWRVLGPLLDRVTLRRWDAGLLGNRRGARRQ